MSMSFGSAIEDRSVLIPVDSVVLEGDLNVPSGAEAIVLFAHGSGSSRHIPHLAGLEHILLA